MILSEAYSAVQSILAPMSSDVFFDQVLGKHFVKISGGGAVRPGMLGSDPEKTILGAYATVAPHLGCHAEEPIGAKPSPRACADERDFRGLIELYHQRRYTIRVPSVRRLAPEVDGFCRALEMIIHQPVSAEVFWSRGDAKAPVHHDDYDLIAVQLRGRKRWFIATDPSPLPNAWPQIPETATPQLGPHQEVEVEQGDLLYLPRGTRHRVDALSDSLHVSIGFVPLTLREAIMASLDYLSDLDRSFREMADGRLGSSILRNRFGALPQRVREGTAKLASICADPDFVAQALQLRSSRAISGLKELAPAGSGSALNIDSEMRHTPRAMSHLSGNSTKIDFSHPGGHLYIHRGATEAVAFIADTPRFRVRQIPGGLEDDVRLALVEKFVAAGFLEVLP